MTRIRLPEVSNLRLIGCDDGPTFHLLGDRKGEEGAVARMAGLEELYEAPIKIVERTPVRMDGGILRAVKTAIMEPVVTLIVNNHHVNTTFEIIDGALREALSFELDKYNPNSKLARIEWETADSTRWLDVVLTEGSTFESDYDPHYPGYWLWEMHLKAYTPYWQEDDVVTSLTFPTAGSQTIEISNPTGVEMYHKFVGTQATWTVPDNSWEGPKWNRAPGGLHPTRTITYPQLTPADGGIVIDYDPSHLPVRNGFNTNLAGRMLGDYPTHVIPPYTQAQELTITAADVPPGGAVMTLRQPRRYRRPWGRV